MSFFLTTGVDESVLGTADVTDWLDADVEES